MTRGRGGTLLRSGRSSCCPAVGVAVVALVAASCGGSATVAEGADGDRPVMPSMELVRFTDVAVEVGLDVPRSAFRWDVGPDPMAMMAGGLCWIDYDRDGWLDLFVTDTWSDGEWGEWRAQGSIPTSRLFRNDAGRFTDVTDETGAGVENRSNGCVAADLDRDGWTDLYVTTERDNVLLWNDRGDGFLDDADREVPSGASTYGWHAGAAVGDVDGNGWPDLFVSGYADLNHPNTETTKPGFPNPFVAERDVLLLNGGPNGGARVEFRDVASAVGIEPDGAAYGLGAVLDDLDLDGDLDLYVANDTMPNQLYEHESDESAPGFRFVERGIEAGVGDEGAGMGVSAGDVDGDGLPDLVTTNQLTEHHVLARNTTVDTLTFADAAAAAGVPDIGVGQTGWGVSWGDVDLDGDLDLVVANGAVPVTDVDADREPLVLLENRLDDDGATLVDVSAPVGLAELGPHVGRGLAMADFDNDGDLDVAVATIGGPPALLRNSGAGGNWLEIAFPTPVPGTSVTARLADGTVVRRQLVAGSSYLSSEDPRVHLGLGANDAVAELLIVFPDGAERRLTDVSGGQVLEIDPEDAG